MIIKKQLCLICFLLIHIIKGQAQDISFRHLTTDDGLSHNAVMTMYQDERGFIWIGTRNGANLYNGHEFKIYKSQKNNPNSLIYNNIRQITGNGNGEIYFMTPKGVSAFNIRLNKFTTLIQKEIRAMFFHKQLYTAYNNCIYKYDGKQFNVYYEFPKNRLKSLLFISAKIVYSSVPRIKVYSVWIMTIGYRISFPKGISLLFFRIHRDNTG